MNATATSTLFMIEANGEPLLFLADAHGIDLDLPLGCTRDRAQAERRAAEARGDGLADVRIVELAD